MNVSLIEKQCAARLMLLQVDVCLRTRIERIGFFDRLKLQNTPSNAFD